MVENSPTFDSPDSMEDREKAPEGWPDTQDGLAATTGLSVLLVDGPQPPAVVVSNNNSICSALQSSHTHRKLCDPYCGVAHRKAIEGRHNCRIQMPRRFAMLCDACRNRRQGNLAVIGGRAFVRSLDYQKLIERFRTGDLQSIASDHLFRNIIFSERQRVRDLADVAARTARRFRPIDPGQSLNHKPSQQPLRLQQWKQCKYHKRKPTEVWSWK